MRRTTMAMLLCGCLLFGGCGSFQLYAQGIPLNATAEQASDADVLLVQTIIITAVVVGVLFLGPYLAFQG